MALTWTIYEGPPLGQRGQGAVEAIVALPVFLLLVCIVFQLFFLGIAQVQLQYAAFYAARVGVVQNSDETEIKRTVRRILAQSPGFLSLPDRSFKIEILETGNNEGEGTETSHRLNEMTLKVRVHWHYPLIVPLANAILKTRGPIPLPGRPSFHLRASWAMANFQSATREKDRAHGERK